jgi:hypothetical protein
MKKRWAFVVENYTAKDLKQFERLWRDGVFYFAVYGEEGLDPGQTPRLQAFVHLKLQKRITFFLKHWPTSKGHETPDNTDMAQLLLCSRGQQTPEEYEEHGPQGANYGRNAKVWRRGGEEPQAKTLPLVSDESSDQGIAPDKERPYIEAYALLETGGTADDAMELIRKAVPRDYTLHNDQISRAFTMFASRRVRDGEPAQFNRPLVALNPSRRKK